MMPACQFDDPRRQFHGAIQPVANGARPPAGRQWPRRPGPAGISARSLGVPHAGSRPGPNPLRHNEVPIREDDRSFAGLRNQLSDYFIGKRANFEIDLDLHGTDFQIRVWTQLLRIPYGKLRTYGQIARALRKPKASRAVGQAAGHNPLPILVPCHRVVGKGGSLVGFAGGITTKARLLRLEGHTLGDASRIEVPRLF